MTIRRATLADAESIVAMGLRFQATSHYAGHLRTSEERIRTITRATLENPNAACWLAEDRSGAVVGMLAAGLMVQPMSDELVGHEIVWWMDPEVRGGRSALAMLKAAEGWAKDAGAVVFQMMSPADQVDHVGEFYERRGYAPIEMHYQRRLDA